MKRPSLVILAPGPHTLVLGGARSGKSRYAESLDQFSSRKPVYIATGAAGDDEMRERIARHREDRGPEWLTVEAPIDLAGAIDAECGSDRRIVVDCLTLWLSNLMLAGVPVRPEIGRLCESLSEARGCPVALVSNEVGSGVVPDNRLAREFRDLQGWLNQEVASSVHNVTLVVAGLPLPIKQQPRVAR